MSIRKRPGGNWYYRFKYRGETYCKGGYVSATEAEEQEASLRAILENPYTFTNLVERRLGYVKTYHSRQHFIDTRTMLRRFQREWGNLPVIVITKTMVKDAVLEMSSHMTNSNVNRHIRALKTLFQVAVDEDIINTNPVRGVKFLPHAGKPRAIPSVAEIQEMLLRAEPEEQAFLTVVWMTGARVSEVYSLPWSRVFFDRGTLFLATRKSKGGDEVLREIPMLPQVRSALEFMWRRRIKGSPWVFTNPKTGEHYGYRHKLIKRVSRGTIGYHDLRHTTASVLVALGVEVPVIQRILGHQSPETTFRYLQTLPHSVVEACKKLGEHYG